MNVPLLIVFGMLVIALFIFLFVRNQKDKHNLEEKLNNDFHKTKDKESDINSDGVLK